MRAARSPSFAGIWTRRTSVRKVKEGQTTNDLFAFLTTEPNAIVAPIHPKAMPVNPDDAGGGRRLDDRAGSEGPRVAASTGG
jgi:putative SOS response-associated peptidase YedK